MKNILTTLALSMSALIATSAMAAPHDYHRNDHNRYYVNDYRAYKNLHQPAKFERWYKVDGRYVLVNERNHHIIRVIR